ncbi:hypothetical protein [Niveispirillum sp.]|uniref:hypothetical protein n=1 Tax=Niveispirillum sp. TaxID=1917217 RepID=UPI001B51527E|nr:hypothetical protein [Niveispirillum sp.]MBP7338830.1 hypothetical protein [Niveispirillum sp.]
MHWLFAVFGFVAGFFAGQFLLMLLLSGGRHLTLGRNQSARQWLGVLNLVIAIIGAVVGWKLGK